jgi:hypothetical protein
MVLQTKDVWEALFKWNESYTIYLQIEVILFGSYFYKYFG